MTISDFQNFDFLIPKFSITKTFFFGKTYKKTFFRIFINPEYMLCKPVFAMPMPNFEAISQFWSPNSQKKTQKLHMRKIVIAIFRSSRPSTKIKYHRWICRQNWIRYTNFVWKDQLQNLTWFDLTWPDLILNFIQMWSKLISEYHHCIIWAKWRIKHVVQRT